MGKKFIVEEIGKIEREDIRNIVFNNMIVLECGERDLYL